MSDPAISASTRFFGRHRIMPALIFFDFLIGIAKIPPHWAKRICLSVAKVSPGGSSHFA